MPDPLLSISSATPNLSPENVRRVIEASLSTPAPRIRVSEQALIRRIRRVLAREAVTLHVCRWDSRWFHDLGRYYGADAKNNLCAPRIDTPDELEEYGREISALAPHEYLSR